MYNYLPLIITFTLALIALFTDRANLEPEGKKKLSKLGYFILILTSISFIFGMTQQYIQNENLEKDEAQRVYIVSQEGKKIDAAIKSILHAFYIIGRPNPSAFSHIRMDSRSNIEELDTLNAKGYWEKISLKNLYTQAWDSVTYGGIFFDRIIFAQEALENIINYKTKYFKNSSVALIYEILSHNGLRNLTNETSQMKAKSNFYQKNLTLYSAILGSENYHVLLQKLGQLQNLVDRNQL